MFIRVKSSPNSPRRSVQVVESVRSGNRVSQVIVRHVGIALDEAEEVKLRAMAEEFINRVTLERVNDSALFATQAIKRKPGRQPRQTLGSVAPVSEVVLADLVEVQRLIEGPHEVLGHLFDYLGFDRIVKGRGTGLLRDLVIARIMAPSSKRQSAEDLDFQYGRTHSLDSLYRLMDSVHERLDALKEIVFEATRSLIGGHVSVMLFDVTTLYFESVATDSLRAFGYSKDQKYHCTQVVMALATNEDGLPIGYELFAGNTAEVSTLLACLTEWQKKLNIDKVSFVADRAMASQANLFALETANWPYVIAMPLRRMGQQEQNNILQMQTATAVSVDCDLLWLREFAWKGRRVILTYSSRRAHKDRSDRQAIIDRLKAKLGKGSKKVIDTHTGEITSAPPKANAKKLISNSGYLRYIERADEGGAFVLDEDKIAADAAWDGLHAVVTNDKQTPAAELLGRYRRLWLIEESFRCLKYSLAVRPIYHFKPERIAAHIGICYLAFALARHAQQRITLAQEAMSIERIRATLHSVQASVLQHKRTHAKYRMPSAFTHDASRIYRAFNLTRNLDAAIDPR